ncbi:amino acid permease [Streptomyces sp. NBC_00873]|uniref:amino acid permease n=1 Tax=unclassified Streptomyces TaxID=2593676 RepID=UPI00386F2109|nr:amino acid permease [Streptomyces sp. NBC_00873]WSY96723.1 amino acid permease [Streptomyces sp. NBC_00873]WTA41503.1 amino acid permease [Streptomyces sp. NBC_00842]WTA48393.1 amino acid permease [Streptomyces sp. NBC_00842]
MTAPADGSAEDERELSRSLTHRHITMIGLGSALGTGLFLGSGSAIATAGPAVILSYAAGAALVGIIGLVLGEMTIAHPVRGAFGSIAQRYLGPWAGFLTRWLYWEGAVVAVGGEVVAAAVYIRFWWPNVPLLAAVLAVAAVVLGVNLISVRSFGVAEFWFSTIKVTALIVFIASGVLLVFFGMPHTPAVGLGNLTRDGGFFPAGGSAVWVAMAVVMFAFAGFETTFISAAETSDPGRSIRTAMRSLVWRLGLFYVVAISLVVTLLPWRESAGGDGSVQASPFVRVFADMGIPAAASLTNAVVLIAAISAANANLYGASRLLHSLGHDRLAPAALGRLNRRGVPVFALIGSACGIAVAAGLAAYGVSNVLSVLVSIAIFAILLVWLLILASYLAFTRGRGHASADGRGGRVPGGRRTAWAGIAGVLAVMATAAVVPAMRQAAVIGLGFTLVLLAVYAVVIRRRTAPSAVEEEPVTV